MFSLVTSEVESQFWLYSLCCLVKILEQQIRSITYGAPCSAVGTTKATSHIQYKTSHIQYTLDELQMYQIVSAWCDSFMVMPKTFVKYLYVLLYLLQHMLSIRLRVSHANDSLIWNVAPGKLTEEVLTTYGHDLHLLLEYSVVPGEVLHGWGGVCISLICLFDCSLVCRPPLGSYHRPSRCSDQNGRYRGNDEWFLKQPGYNVGMSCSVLFYRIWDQTWWEMPLYVR